MGLFLHVLEMHVEKKEKTVLKKSNFDSVLGSHILSVFWE